ncbi:unnamed protein product [Tetraodon nigroviridis]|uniref:Cilia- and flagella-associated protein 418 n=1 Tax=Tetraodon nigroviridis TaxID=99883 RepID=Q4S482_TETNG|nr:unnamed protein product [Tetraodon nigroviridis]
MEDDDDLDELLDDVERRFCKNVSVSAASGQSNEAFKSREDNAGHGLPKPKQTVREVIEDIDAFLEELLDAKDDGCQQLKTKSEGCSEEKKTSSSAGQRKCCPVFLGGSSVMNGVGTVTSKRSCDQLRAPLATSVCCCLRTVSGTRPVTTCSSETLSPTGRSSGPS